MSGIFRKMNIGSNKYHKFISSNMTENITDIPGIGFSSKKKFLENGIKDAPSLIQFFISLKGYNDDRNLHCNKFMHELDSFGIDHNKSEITQSISEKVDIMFPNLYSDLLDNERITVSYLSDKDYIQNSTDSERLRKNSTDSERLRKNSTDSEKLRKNSIDFDLELDIIDEVVQNYLINGYHYSSDFGDESYNIEDILKQLLSEIQEDKLKLKEIGYYSDTEQSDDEQLDNTINFNSMKFSNKQLNDIAKFGSANINLLNDIMTISNSNVDYDSDDEHSNNDSCNEHSNNNSDNEHSNNEHSNNNSDSEHSNNNSDSEHSSNNSDDEQLDDITKSKINRVITGVIYCSIS